MKPKSRSLEQGDLLRPRLADPRHELVRLEGKRLSNLLCRERGYKEIVSVTG